MARITSLPVELVEHIAQDIAEIVDLQNLRLTCKDTERKVLKHFSERCFHERRFMISSKSLDTLLYIAHHPTFQKSLKVVKFGTEHAPDGERILSAIMQSSNWLNGKAKFDEAMDEYHAWTRKGEDVAMIAKAIHKLENLQEIGVLADFENHSYGFAHWTTESGFPPVMRTTSEGREALTIRRLSWTVLQAVEIARKPIALAFTVARGQHHEWCFLPSTVFSTFDVDEIQHTCDFTHTLKLRFDCHQKNELISLKGPRKFVASFKALRHLHLIQALDSKVSATATIVRTGFHPLFAEDFQLQYLVSLFLEGVQYQTDELIRFLRHTRSTLRNLSMIACWCQDRNCGELLAMMRDELSLDSIELGGNVFGAPTNLLTFPKRGVKIPPDFYTIVFDLSRARCHDWSKMRAFLTFLLSRMCLLETLPRTWSDEGGVVDIVGAFDHWRKAQTDPGKRPERYTGVDSDTFDQPVLIGPINEMDQLVAEDSNDTVDPATAMGAPDLTNDNTTGND
jgi:hypothetical protein